MILRAETGPAVQVDPARVGKKSVYRVEEIEVAVGDRLKWTKNHRSPTGVGVGATYPQDTRLKWTKNQATLGRRNGQEFEVCAIEDGQILIRYGSGKTESLNCSELAYLDYALVSTTYSTQGKSAERVIGALDRHVGRESFYVTVSRVKHDLKLYASEDLDRLIERVERSRAKENPNESLLWQQSQFIYTMPVEIRKLLGEPTALSFDHLEREANQKNKHQELEFW
jgi:ATP-dependent exoDNAse (exonuclease V) alpha subunit